MPGTKNDKNKGKRKIIKQMRKLGLAYLKSLDTELLR